MKKKFFLCLIEIVSLTCMGHAAGLPVLPLPKVISTVDGANKGEKVYGDIDFIWRNTNPELYNCVQEEFKEFFRDSCPDRLKIIGEQSSSKKVLRAFCREHSLDEHYVDSIGPEGYLLSKSDSCIHVISKTTKGLLYGIQSAKQLVRGGYAPSVALADWPDYPQRIFFDDISRGPISNVTYIKKQIRNLSELKYNAFTFYIEHVIQPLSYPDFAPENGKLTMDDVKEICSYAREYQMEIIGSFQCFGHFEKILSLEKYAPLGDTPSMIAPLKPQAQAFLKSVIEELADTFSSDYFNINCDETWDLENGKSKEYVRRVGADKFYADHIRFLYDVLKAKNKKVMMWGDIIMKYPHLLSELPKDITYLSWNYSGTNYDAWINPFKENRSCYLVCPGILNSNRLFPDLNMTRENMQFITDGYRAGAQGVLYTSWDDSAFHSFASIMYGVALASEYSWNASRNVDADDFEGRYCMVRFGSEDTMFVQALNELMKFAKLGMTYEMNDRIFYERFTPDINNPLNINKEELGIARNILASVKRTVSAVHLQKEHIDEKALGYTVAQYEFIVDARERMFKMADWYRKSLQEYAESPEQARKSLIMALKDVNPLETQILTLKQQYTELWICENQSYFLDKGLELYKEKLDQIHRVQSVLLRAIDFIDRGRKPDDITAAGLDVRNINSNYFSCWLFCGAFLNGDMNTDYLATIGGEINVTPLPGERFDVGGDEYKWTRCVSDNGFIMDFNEMFHSVNNGVAYATAMLYSDKEQIVQVLYGGSGENLIYCNGQIVGHTAKENEFVADKYKLSLHLKAGSNRILIKSRQLVNDWKFSFRVDGRIVKSHKQKYYL